MKNIITGTSRIRTHQLDGLFPSLSERTRSVRFVHELERLAVTAVELLLKDAAIEIPVGREDIGVYMGIDDSVEDIKNEFFRNILEDGILGASPLLFPFTSPNALTAQAAIVFDIRGESVLLPVVKADNSVIEYADDSISLGYTKMAVAGSIFTVSDHTSQGYREYEAGFYFLESRESADERGIRIYENMPGGAA